MKILLQRVPSGFVPADDDAEEKCKRFKIGSLVNLDVHEVRNYNFHKKFFALLKVGFDHWEPPVGEHHGMPVQKNFERFRKDVVIAAGFYDLVSNIRGDVRAEAKSIAFGSMSEDEFGKLYNAVVDVLLQRVLKNYKRDDLDHVVKQIMDFGNRG